jgi:hypothetical protein
LAVIFRHNFSLATGGLAAATGSEQLWNWRRVPFFLHCRAID